MAKRPGTARGCAYELHAQVWREGAYANLAWPRILADAALSQQDRAFATELAYGSLRRFGQWQRVVEAASGRSGSQLQPDVLWVLVIGTHQLLAMSTPVHAAVHETVTLCKAVGLSRASGLVNAVLRRIARMSLDQWLDQITSDTEDPDEQLGMRHAHPAWVVRALRESLEREGASEELVELLESHNQPASTHLALLEGEPKPEDIPTPWSPRGVLVAGDPAQDPRVRAGVARVQDQGSQLAALVAAAARPLEPHARVLDACAGPGGKTAMVAATIEPSVVAVEQHPHRADLVRDSVRALDDGAVEVITEDVVDHLAGAQPYDLILLDAPCSGLGALRRRPEARWTKSAEDLTGLITTQQRLLQASLENLAPGGRLVYVTCSPVVAETTGQMDWAVSTIPGVEAVPTGPVLAEVARQPLEGAAVGTAVQLWPHRHHSDAMFIQILQRTGSD